MHKWLHKCMGRAKRGGKIQSKIKLPVHKLSESDPASAKNHQHASFQLFLFLPVLQGKGYLYRRWDGNLPLGLQKPPGRFGG